MQTSRTAFAVIAWGFLGLLAIQVFLAGIGLFGAGTMQGHREFGYLVGLAPVIVLIAAAVARAGRLIGLSAALLVLAFVQTSLPYFKDDAPFVAALHPVNALALFWLTLTIAHRATALARSARPGPSSEAESAVTHPV